MSKIDIHNFKRRLSRAESALQLATFQGDKDLIYEFENQMFADGLGLPRVVKYLASIKALYKLAALEHPACEQEGNHNITGAHREI